MVKISGVKNGITFLNGWKKNQNNSISEPDILICLGIISGWFHVTMAELSSFNRGSMAP